MRTRPIRLVMTALAAALLGVAPPVDAATVVGFAEGSGAIFPGLTNVPTDQNVDFVLHFLAGATTDGMTVLASGCTYDGHGDAETVLAGRGTGFLSGCTTGSIAGGLQYVRIANHYQFVGLIRINGRDYDFQMHCLTQPTSINPSTSYVLECGIV